MESMTDPGDICIDFLPMGKCQPLEVTEYRFIIILPPDPDSFPPFSEETALLAPEVREVSESFKEKHIHRATIQSNKTFIKTTAHTML